MKKERLDQELILKIKERLRARRINANITQETILKTTGIHIGRIENKNYVMNISITTLKVLCDQYNITLSELLEDL